jgi:sugar phosphate isomerase/epimerase
MKLAVAVPLLTDSRRIYADLRDHLDYAHSNLFEGVELHIDNPSKINFTRLEQMIRETGLEPVAIGTGMTYTRFGLSFLDDRTHVRRAATQRAIRYIELASELHCPVILALIRGRYSPRLGKRRALQRLSETLGRLNRIAERKEVRLLLEPVNRYETNMIHTLSDAADMIERCEATATKILLDTYHMNIEEESPDRAIRCFGRLLGHVHLADCNRGAPGQGHIEFRGILDTLKNVGYRGWLSAEIMFKPDEENALKQTYSTIKPLL